MHLDSNRVSKVLVVLALATLSPTSRADTNEWLKPGSGNWEEPYWSLERLPTHHDVVIFGNAGFKSLAISQSTVTSASQSLSIQSLTIEAPAGSSNLLLLNWAGMNVPLSVSSNLMIGTNGSLVSPSSAMNSSNFYIGSTAQFLDQSAASFTNVFVGPNASAELDLSNSVLPSACRATQTQLRVKVGTLLTTGNGLNARRWFENFKSLITWKFKFVGLLDCHAPFTSPHSCWRSLRPSLRRK